MMYDLTNDAKQIWQAQERKHTILSVELVRAKALAVQKKARRTLAVTIALGILLLIAGAIALVEVQRPRLITGALMIVVVVAVWSAYSRISAPAVLAADAALKDCVRFYRRELQSQYRNAFGSAGLTWRFAAALAIYAAITANLWARSLGPFIVRILIPTLLLLLIVVRRWEAMRFKRELAALDEFERETS
jgi:hypothetical protein